MVILELEEKEALQLQNLLTITAMHLKQDDKPEALEAAATVMRLSLKLTTAILQAFWEKK